MLTWRLLTTGTGVTGVLTGPMPSKNVYSALSVLIIVHEAPSFIISLLASFGHGVACNVEKNLKQSGIQRPINPNCHKLETN